MFMSPQNILEFHIFDADKLTKDDYCSTILFDINNLTPGQKQTKCFISEDKVENVILLLFYIILLYFILVFEVDVPLVSITLNVGNVEWV